MTTESIQQQKLLFFDTHTASTVSRSMGKQKKVALNFYVVVIEDDRDLIGKKLLAAAAARPTHFAGQAAS